MRLRYSWLCFLVVTALSCSRAHQSCPVCQRETCRGFAFQITLANGKTLKTCCPRCGLEYLNDSKLRAQSLQATDFASGRWIDASQAVYVSGSDVSHCSMDEAHRDAYGCCYYKSFDRCEPSVLAFASKQEAADFIQQHHGRMIDYADLRDQIAASVARNDLKPIDVAPVETPGSTSQSGGKS